MYSNIRPILRHAYRLTDIPVLNPLVNIAYQWLYNIGLIIDNHFR